MTKGQGQVIGILGIGVTIALASIGGFFVQNNRVAAVETRTAVLESQYQEINKRLEKIDGTMEQIKQLIVRR